MSSGMCQFDVVVARCLSPCRFPLPEARGPSFCGAYLFLRISVRVENRDNNYAVAFT